MFEETERSLPEFLSKEEVLKIANSPAEKEEASFIQEKDPAFAKRESNLIPIAELFENMPVRIKKQKGEFAEKKADLPIDVDLRKYSTPAKDQINGRCTAYGLTSVQELMHCKQNGVCNLDLSEAHRWSMYKKYAAWSALENAKTPIVEEKIWPEDQSYSPKNISKYAKFKIDEWEYLGDSKQKVLTALANGFAVYFWSQTPNAMLKCKKVSSKTEKTFADGGHAYAVVGYFDKEDPLLIIKNSWGEDCGDNGYQVIPFSIYDYASYWEAAAIKKVSISDVPNSPKIVTKCEYKWSVKHFWKKVKYCWEEYE